MPRVTLSHSAHQSGAGERSTHDALLLVRSRPWFSIHTPARPRLSDGGAQRAVPGTDATREEYDVVLVRFWRSRGGALTKRQSCTKRQGKKRQLLHESGAPEERTCETKGYAHNHWGVPTRKEDPDDLVDYRRSVRRRLAAAHIRRHACDHDAGRGLHDVDNGVFGHRPMVQKPESELWPSRRHPFRSKAIVFSCL
jgi:hypothetical protein